MQTERWKDIPGWPNYRVSDLGRVLSWQRDAPRILKPNNDNNGYKCIRLSGSNGEKIFRVHALVLTAFVGPRPDGMEACHHPDPDPSNNRLDNLRWDTHVKNMQDMVTQGRRTPAVRKVARTPAVRKVARGAVRGNVSDADALLMCKMYASGWSIYQIAKLSRVSESAVRDICTGRRRNHIAEQVFWSAQS